jgi:hypothetical protein
VAFFVHFPSPIGTCGFWRRSHILDYSVRSSPIGIENVLLIALFRLFTPRAGGDSEILATISATRIPGRIVAKASTRHHRGWFRAQDLFSAGHFHPLQAVGTQRVEPHLVFVRADHIHHLALHLLLFFADQEGFKNNFTAQACQSQAQDVDVLIWYTPLFSKSQDQLLQE